MHCRNCENTESFTATHSGHAECTVILANDYTVTDYDVLHIEFDEDDPTNIKCGKCESTDIEP